MQDLTKITTPFGLLDKETQYAIRMHEGAIEYFNGKNWVDTNPSYFHNSTTYRAKREPMTIWVNEYESGGLGSAHRCEQTAKDAVKRYGPKRTIKFVEVMK